MQPFNYSPDERLRPGAQISGSRLAALALQINSTVYWRPASGSAQCGAGPARCCRAAFFAHKKKGLAPLF
jgi:hypothetical protein